MYANTLKGYLGGEVVLATQAMIRKSSVRKTTYFPPMRLGHEEQHISTSEHYIVVEQ